MTLIESLNECLPNGEEFKLLSLQSNSIEIDSIITKSKKRNIKCNSSKTIKTQHFFALSHNDKFVFALEVYIYINLDNFDINKQIYTYGERLVFVSKADTNGYSDVKFSVKNVTEQILRFLLSIDPNYYLKKIKPLKRKYDKVDKQHYIIGKSLKTSNSLKILASRLHSFDQVKELEKSKYYLSLTFTNEFVNKICLFTRPADHYLFADSGNNSNKHKLNGTQLLEWWLGIIDNIVQNDFRKDGTTIAKLRIPGDEDFRVRRHLENCNFSNWHVGDIFNGSSNSLAAFNVPLFPDDPKSRFLHQLVEENRILKTNLKQFWIELQERQEFKLNVLVSVIGVSGFLKQPHNISKLLPNFILKTKSLQQFASIKNFITAEEYSDEEGALESFSNINDYLDWKKTNNLLLLKGQKMYETSKAKKSQKVHVLQVHTLKPRKKQKIEITQ